MSSIPTCGVCYTEVHPVDKPAKRIVCGHVFCTECITRLIFQMRPCPLKCRSGARLRFRDTRTLHFSIVPTTERDDRKAVADVVKAVASELQHLESSAEENSKRIKTLGHRVTNQLSTLSRFSPIHRSGLANQKDVMQKIWNAERLLQAEVEREKTLLGELEAAQQKFLELSQACGSVKYGPSESLDFLAAHPSTTQSSPAYSNHRSLTDPRLELQQIRYDHLARPFIRPLKLEFAGRPKIPIVPNDGNHRYVYKGIFNSTPYDLLECPTNALFLRQEAQMHDWVNRVRHLKQLHDDANFLLCCQSVEKDLTSSLDRLFQWKIEIYFEQHVSPEKNSVSPLPTVETTRYLQIYDYDGGDPLYNRLILPGILLVLVLHLVFNGSRGLCEVVLALLHDQLDGLQGLVTDQRLEHLQRILPNTIKGALGVFEFDPVVRRFVVCSQCYAIVPKTEDSPILCQYKETPASPPCSAKLTRTDHATTGMETRRPIKEYLHQDFREWLGRFLCRPDIEEMLDSRKTTSRQRKAALSQANVTVHDILESKGLQEFSWPDGKAFYDCPDNEFRLFFALSGDGFNPLFNREAKQTVTSTGLYLFCLNLPLEERQKPENVYLAGVIPGPDKPSGTQINHYISLIVDDFLPFWNTGVRYTRTWKRPTGALCRTAIVPVLADALGVRQLCGYGSVTSTFFCTFCWLPLSNVENFNKSSWPQRDLETHRFWAEQWKEADSVTRERLVEDHGIRHTPLLRLPYFDPPKYSIVDTMHNFFTGILQRHCRNIWGMDIEVEDGNGEFPPGSSPPLQPSLYAMREARKALQLGDVAALTKSRKDALWYLCLDLDRRRGRNKKDLIRELLRWRKAQGPFITDPRWEDTETAEETAAPFDPLFRTYQSTLPVTSLPSQTGPQLGGAIGYSADATPLTSSSFKNLFLPRRDAAVPPQVLVTRSNHGVSVKTKKHARPNTAVLGSVILKAVGDDMQKTMVPRWISPAPIRAGQKKHGKLSADQWRVFCGIHLAVTLIRLWGRQPEDSRWYKMLINFLDLVKAVEIGSMLVTSRNHIDEYETLMTRYLVTMKSLYKEARVVPNHHLALHTADFLDYRGPSPETHDLTIIHPEGSGSRLNDLLRPTAPALSNVKKRQSKQSTPLSAEEVAKLTALLSSEQELQTPQASSEARLLNPVSSSLHSFKLRGITYRPFSRSPRDSNVLIGSGSEYRPAQLEKIFLHRREVAGEEVREEIFCKIRFLQALPLTIVEQDWFRQFGSIGGSLWSTECEHEFLMIRPESIICHFARTRLEEVDTGFGRPTFHVLPLDRLRTQIERTGPPMKDDAFEDVAGSEDEDDQDQMDID
ncbi:hypothetical protein EST38_g7389 [Candolleomyces aberdarensis]|uniref:RING-type domain-containing protein n=1 Tax=Candolleomyces aberdarensis TaxID=2316362 RepID=A0A4Q2DI44_9AGAR|nr:hypothetical protein EST38_g7389 [Candolleomyces aberdarensis]